MPLGVTSTSPLLVLSYKATLSTIAGAGKPSFEERSSRGSAPPMWSVILGAEGRQDEPPVPVPCEQQQA